MEQAWQVLRSAKDSTMADNLNNLTNPLWTGPQIATSNLLIFDMDGNSLSNNRQYDVGIST